MNGDEPSLEAPRPAGATIRLLLIVALVAFLVGLGAMALGLQYLREQRAAESARQAAALAPAGEAVRTDAPAAAPPLPGTDLNSLAAREQVLAMRIAELESRLAGINLTAREASSYAGRAEGLMVAFAARRALDRGLALGYVEDQLRERFGETHPQAVAAVVQASRQPVTLEDLRLALDTLAPRLTTGSQDGWWQSLKRELSNLIVLREEGTPSPRPADRLTRARRMLDAGQVEAALAEVARLPGAPAASSWIEAAKRYINARRALNTIELAAIQGRAAPPQLAGGDRGEPVNNPD